jgi:hypothetical protein
MCGPAKGATLLAMAAVQTAIAASGLLAGPNGLNGLAEVHQEPDVITIERACEMLGCSRRWLFRHKSLPFVKRLSRKNLVVDAAKLKAWIADNRR